MTRLIPLSLLIVGCLSSSGCLTATVVGQFSSKTTQAEAKIEKVEFGRERQALYLRVTYDDAHQLSFAWLPQHLQVAGKPEPELREVEELPESMTLGYATLTATEHGLWFDKQAGKVVLVERGKAVANLQVPTRSVREESGNVVLLVLLSPVALVGDVATFPVQAVVFVLAFFAILDLFGK